MPTETKPPPPTIRLGAGGTAVGGCLLAIAVAGVVLGLIAAAGVVLVAVIDAVEGSAAVRSLRVPLVAGAAATGATWLAAVAAVRITRQPRTPAPGPDTADLRPEPPAVANMLVNDFHPTRDALPATLLDLAARRVVDIERSATGGYQVRLGPRRPQALAPYEARILSLLRARAAGGVVPAEALTTGPTDHARSWWRAFRREVVAEAQARDLSRDLWDAAILRTLGILALVPAALLAVALLEVAAGVGVLMGAATILSGARGGGRQRHTTAGLEAAAGWLGIRRYLRGGAFSDLPPTAVAVWERYLAYAAALGVAADAVRAIPMGADDDRRAWSAASGEWRQVEIRYPRLWPPGWGMNPWAAVASGLVIGGISWFIVSMFARIGWPDGGSRFPEEVAWGLGIFGVVGVAVGAVAGTWALLLVILAAADLGSQREVAGEVLRLRSYGGGKESEPRCYVALDDGTSAGIRAWRVRPALYRSAGLAEYRPAAASVTRNLGYVRWIRPVA